MEKRINIKIVDSGNIEIACEDKKIMMDISEKRIDAKELYELLDFSVGDSYVLEPLPADEGRDSDNDDHKLLEEIASIIKPIINQIDELNTQLREQSTKEEAGQ